MRLSIVFIQLQDRSQSDTDEIFDLQNLSWLCSIFSMHLYKITEVIFKFKSVVPTNRDPVLTSLISGDARDIVLSRVFDHVC